ncbi:Flp family type IVb pilin [Blastopirellula marina]|uniref:Flp family type IVb pilin n=1 Tax=Blastopirellula marina TaxID=124 RepID=A0A2S8FP65_9BACT|nr:class III signal peptide-containing protein [Blastopirellula marina]PQO33664.1 hypothetical protein C5Y98_15620 [Blastopirellula marina]PTL43451.1 class III signal peptide-containing protein [Blastopirellula marina]
MLKLLRNRKGQGMVEYGLIIAGVALVCAVSVSVFGNKVGDMIAAAAAVLPGAQSSNNAPIQVGQLIETKIGDDGWIVLDVERIYNASNTPRLGNNFGLENPIDFGSLVLDVTP